MPDGWAKKRLILEGPTKVGTDASRDAVVAIAAELRQQGVDESEVRAHVASHLSMFETGTTTGRQLLRQLERSVRWAYSKDPNTPILSGCCRDPRPRAGSHRTGRLRATFEEYCDDGCAVVCPMLRSIRNPSRSLAGTPFELLDRSCVWMNGGGLGIAGQRVYQLLAQQALVRGTSDVQVSATFATLKLDGQYDPKHLGKVLKKLQDAGIVELLDPKTGMRRVHALDAEAIAWLEEERGVAGRRQANIRAACLQADAHAAYLSDAETALEDWDPPAQ